MLETHLFAIHTWKKVPNLQDCWSWCETQLLHSHFMVAWSIKSSFPRCSVVCKELQAQPARERSCTYCTTQNRVQTNHQQTQPCDFHLASQRRGWLNPYLLNTYLKDAWALLDRTDRQNMAPSLISSVALSLPFSGYGSLFGRKCCLVAQSEHRVSSETLSSPTYIVWRWRGGARLFQSLPAHYMSHITAFPV